MKTQMLRNKWFFVTCAGVVAAVGCAASTSPQNTTNNNDAGGAGSNDAGNNTSDDTGTGPGSDDTGVVVQSVALPFFVSDQFVASGYEGDYTGLTLSQDLTKCKTPREANAGGDCYTATWVPNVGDAGSAWTGVFWQSPANNWGSKPGKPIAPGATKVTFYAAGAVGGEIITASVGGINKDGASAALPYGDFTLSASTQPITLTTTWTQYTISFSGQTYTTVLGGFSFVTTAMSDTSQTFYIDDIEWQ